MTTLAAPRQTLSATAMLIAAIVDRLLPLFLSLTDGDPVTARIIAIETINAHCARNNADVLAIAQIIACGMASLDNLILSMADDISRSLRLRLQSTANAMNRAVEQNRRFLKQTPPAASGEWFGAEETAFEAAILAGAHQQTADAEAQPGTSDAPEPPDPAIQAAGMPHQPMPKPATMPAQPAMPRPPMPKPDVPASEMPARTVPDLTEQEKAVIWANGMNRVAAEFTASIPYLPPAQRPGATLRANALSSTASALIARTLTEQPATP